MLYCFKIFSRFEKSKTGICQTYIKVSCNRYRATVQQSTDRQKLNNPPHIAAHLQVAQAQAKAKLCKRAAILPTHPSPPVTPTEKRY